MFVRSLLLSLLFVLTACITSGKPIALTDNSPQQAQIEAENFNTFTLTVAKSSYGEPELAEEIIIDNLAGLSPYQQNSSYQSLVNQLNSHQEVILIHSLWQRYQHNTEVTYYQQEGDWFPIEVKVTAAPQASEQTEQSKL